MNGSLFSVDVLQNTWKCQKKINALHINYVRYLS